MKWFYSILGNRLLGWLLLTIPAVYLMTNLHDGVFGHAWEFARVQDYLGNTAITLLISVLCLTPLRVLFPRLRLVAALNRHRRAIGVSVFLYAGFHLFVFLRNSSPYDIPKFVYLQAGVLAFLILMLLALMSNDFVVWLLGYGTWKFIHRLAYLAAILAFFHRGFMPKKHETLSSTMALFAPLVLLEILRILRQGLNFTVGVIRHWHTAPAFGGWRDFRVARKVKEAGDIVSVYFEPVKRFRLKPFHPGQYLTYEFKLEGRDEPVIRCYSLSDAPAPDHYRASIKRVRNPPDHPEYLPGLVSNFVHDQLKEGQVLRVRAPGGTFWLNPGERGPVVLIGAGIGVTPVLSMLKTLAQRQSRREVLFFYGVRHVGEDALRPEIEEAVRQLPNGRLVICHSEPQAGEVAGKDYTHAERVSVDLLQKVLKHNRYDFYFCGPGPLMEHLVDKLTAWGVPDKRLHFEAFGPSSLRRRDLPADIAVSAKIIFRKSHKTLQWNGAAPSLLDFAEAQGLKLRFGCRSGVCGTCKVRVRKGEIVYAHEPAADPGGGACLVCTALPKGDLELDA